jgi:ATP/ADP translocase
MQKLFERFFSIRPGELGRVGAFFLHYTCIGMLYTFGATAGDSLFLTNVPPEMVDRVLAWVYIGRAELWSLLPLSLLIGLISGFLIGLLARWSRDRLDAADPRE